MQVRSARSYAREAAEVTLLAGLLSFVGGPPAPGLPALLARIEVLSGWPLAGLAWATAIGALAAWAARLSAGLNDVGPDDAGRATVLAAVVAPALLPGAGVIGCVPALWLAASLARRTSDGADRRVALLLVTAVVGTLADPRVASAGAFAMFAAARHLLGVLGQVPANDNAPPSFACRIASGHLQGSCPQFISE